MLAFLNLPAMTIRAIVICTAILSLSVFISGCGKEVPTDTVTDSNELTNQIRVAKVTSSSIGGYNLSDNILIRISNDRLSLQGGGGITPIITGLSLTETATSGTYTGSRTIGGDAEVYTVVVADNLITDLSINVAGSGDLSALVGIKPTIDSDTDGEWRAAAMSTLQDQTGNTRTRMTVDSMGLLWWDLDNLTATTDDVVMIVLNTSNGYLEGSATVYYDWDDDLVDDLVVIYVRLTLSTSGEISRIYSSADPVDGALGSGQIWVDDSAPTRTLSNVPRFGPWSASMAGHWLAIPTSGSTELFGQVSVTRIEREYNSSGVPSGSATLTGSDYESETVDISYSIDEFSGYPVVKMTVETMVDKILGGGTEFSRYAVYYAMGSNGVVYRVGQWEDVDADGAVDSDEESMYGTEANAVVAFPASEPANSFTYVYFSRFGLKTVATHLRDQTFDSIAKQMAQVGALTTATTTPAPSGFSSVTGAGTDGKLTTYWIPGSGITGMRWATGSKVVRQLKRSDGTYQQIVRTVNSYADLVIQ